MARNEKCYGCNKCKNGGMCICKTIVGFIIAIAVLSIAFSFAKSLLGSFLGTGVWPSIPQFAVGIVVFLVIIWAISWVIRLPLRLMYGSSRRDLRILRKRYARGEINDAQFKKMMKNLKG